MGISAISANPVEISAHGARPSAWPLNAAGVWFEVPDDRPAAPGPVLFLDRDGVIIVDRDFVSRRSDVALVAGAAALIRAANEAGVAVAVASNQSGIDRGLYGWDSFAEVQDEIARRLGAEGARIDAVAACPFHPDITTGYGAAHARWRKPGPGMISALADTLNADLARSWMIGDSARDLEAARAAGVEGLILVAGKADETATTLGAVRVEEVAGAHRALAAALFTDRAGGRA